MRTDRIFLSYANEDINSVRNVYQRLKKLGHKPWFDKENLLPGQRWENEIPEAIKASDFIIVFFSKASVAKRGYVQKEFKLALEVLETVPEEQIFIIPVRLDECSIPKRFKNLQYCDLFEPDGFGKILRTLINAKDHKEIAPEKTPPYHIEPSLHLRSKPTSISENEIRLMLQKYGFFESNLNSHGRGIKHDYETIRPQIDKLVVDHTTGLIWQPSGSPFHMTGECVRGYIEELNKKNFGSFNDWRLPTVEEAMSLMESFKSSVRIGFFMRTKEMYISQEFDRLQFAIWTADTLKEAEIVYSNDFWVAHFLNGIAYAAGGITEYFYVRTVRSGFK